MASSLVSSYQCSSVLCHSIRDMVLTLVARNYSIGRFRKWLSRYWKNPRPSTQSPTICSVAADTLESFLVLIGEKLTERLGCIVSRKPFRTCGYCGWSSCPQASPVPFSASTRMALVVLMWSCAVDSPDHGVQCEGRDSFGHAAGADSNVVRDAVFEEVYEELAECVASMQTCVRHTGIP